MQGECHTHSLLVLSLSLFLSFFLPILFARRVEKRIFQRFSFPPARRLRSLRERPRRRRAAAAAAARTAAEGRTRAKKLEESLKNSIKQNWNFAFLAASVHETIKVIALGFFVKCPFGQDSTSSFFERPPRSVPGAESAARSPRNVGGRREGPLFSF